MKVTYSEIPLFPRVTVNEMKDPSTMRHSFDKTEVQSSLSGIPTEIILPSHHDSDSLSVTSSIAVYTDDSDSRQQSSQKFKNFLEPISRLPVGRPLACPPRLDRSKTNDARKRYITRTHPRVAALALESPLKKSRRDLSCEQSMISLVDASSKTISSRSSWTPCLSSSSIASTNPTVQELSQTTSQNILSDMTDLSSRSHSSFCESSATISSFVEEFQNLPSHRHDKMTLLSVIASQLIEKTKL